MGTDGWNPIEAIPPRDVLLWSTQYGREIAFWENGEHRIVDEQCGGRMRFCADDYKRGVPMWHELADEPDLD